MSIISKFFARQRTPKQELSNVRSPFIYQRHEDVNPDTAMKLSAFYRGVMYISTQMAKLPLDIKDRNNKKLFRENIIYRLMNISPNEEIASFWLINYMIQTALIWGNAYAEIERNRLGIPVAIHLIRPELVVPERDRKTGKLWYRVRKAAYDGSDVLLAPRDIFHIKNFHTKDGLFGQGLAVYASDTLGIAAGANRFAKGLFDNSGTPSGVVTLEGSLSDEAFVRLKEQWKEQHSGRKVGGVAILEQGTTYKPITLEPEAMQFLESKKFNVLEIARFLGLPPTKLFDGESATYNNIEHSNLEVATDTLDSWARNIESEISFKLLDYPGSKAVKAEYDLYAVFRGDMDTRSQYFLRMLQAAAISPNEIRDKEGFAKYEGGDRFYVATNNYTPHDRIDDVVDSQIGMRDEANGQEKTRQEEADKVNKAVVEFLNKKSTI